MNKLDCFIVLYHFKYDAILFDPPEMTSSKAFRKIFYS